MGFTKISLFSVKTTAQQTLPGGSTLAAQPLGTFACLPALGTSLGWGSCSRKNDCIAPQFYQMKMVGVPLLEIGSLRGVIYICSWHKPCLRIRIKTCHSTLVHHTVWCLAFNKSLESDSFVWMRDWARKENNQWFSPFQQELYWSPEKPYWPFANTKSPLPLWALKSSVH